MAAFFQVSSNQFLEIGRFLQNRQRVNPIPGVDVEATSIEGALNKIETSLEGHFPLISFPPGKVVQCFGYPKLGCVKDGKIQIARDGWLSPETQLADKIEVSAMELFMYMQIPGRYQRADLVANLR